MKQEQTNQIIPRLFYRPSVASTIELEMSHFRMLTWANRCNGNGSFELEVPLDLADFIPQLGGVFYTKYRQSDNSDYYDTLMFVERVVRRRLKTGQVVLSVSGSPRAIPEADLEDAQNNNAFYVWRYDQQDRTFSKLRFDVNSGGQIHEFDSDDIDESAIAEDNLGGHEGAVIAYKWGTVLTGLPQSVQILWYPAVTGVIQSLPTRSNVANFWTFSYADTNDNFETNNNYIGAVDSYNFQMRYFRDPFISGQTYPAPVLVEGESFGAEGYMNHLAFTGSWIKTDEIQDIVLKYSAEIQERDGNTLEVLRTVLIPVSTIVSTRVIELKTVAEYVAEMHAFMPDPASGTVYEDPDAVFVKGGHRDYTFSLKTWGNRRLEWSEPSPYPLFLNLGALVQINDTLLLTEVTDILSGVVETIDDNGYNIELELGTIFPRISTGF